MSKSKDWGHSQHTTEMFILTNRWIMVLKKIFLFYGTKKSELNFSMSMVRVQFTKKIRLQGIFSAMFTFMTAEAKQLLQAEYRLQAM